MHTRKFSRVEFRVDSTIKTAERQFHGNVENLSMNGMFLITDEKLTIGEPVYITIRLTGSDPEIAICCQGRVCRATDSGLGFAFEKIDLDSFTHLKNIISYNLNDSETVLEEIYHSISEKLNTK